MTYCVVIEKTIRKKVLVYADSAEEALDKTEQACDAEMVDFVKFVDDEEYEYTIDSDSSKEDDTFDDQFCSDGLQIIE